MSRPRRTKPNEWVFLTGILFLVLGSALVALLDGLQQFMAVPAFVVSGVCALVYLRSVVAWRPPPQR